MITRSRDAALSVDGSDIAAGARQPCRSAALLSLGGGRARPARLWGAAPEGRGVVCVALVH